MSLSDWLTPGPLYNAITAPPMTPLQVLAGPMGLLAFLPLAPLVRGIACFSRPAALLIGGLAWLVLTLGPAGTAAFLGALSLGAGWILFLAMLRRGGRLGERGMIAMTWLGLHALAYPLWIFPHPFNYGWQPGPIAALHALGLAYFLLRFIAWGVEVAKNPATPIRPIETICWILYPPCMRLGPIMNRPDFFTRMKAWNPRAAPPWSEVGRRFGLFVLGGIGIGVVGTNLTQVLAGRTDFFSAPQQHSTSILLLVVYLVPIQIYLILWTYNELAAVCSRLVGIPVDNNFDYLPCATSIRDFWRRWHITVGAWLREYIYIPLGGNRGIVPLNYAAVFGYCGVWHGASWSFLAWGLLQAVALSVQRAWDKVIGAPRATRNGLTLLRVTAVIWTAVCWLLTMHYQILTIVVFADFDYLGMRIFGELFSRAIGALGG